MPLSLKAADIVRAQIIPWEAEDGEFGIAWELKDGRSGADRVGSRDDCELLMAAEAAAQAGTQRSRQAVSERPRGLMRTRSGNPQSSRNSRTRRLKLSTNGTGDTPMSRTFRRQRQL
jgi:hypothetical protein